MADRIQRYVKHEGISEAEAKNILEKGDARRSTYYNYYTQRTWGAAANYDLCVNSSRLGIEVTAQQIIRFVDAFFAQKA